MYDNDVNHMLYPPQEPDLNPTEQDFGAAWDGVHPCMPGSIKAVLEAQTLNVVVPFNLSPICVSLLLS